MANTKKVKLGETANSFYDPITEVKVLPGQLVELTKNQQRSRKITVGLRHGHLVVATEEDIEAFENEGVVSNNDETNDEDTNWDDFDDYTEAGLKKLTKTKLVELAMHLESTYPQTELQDMNKTELAEEILEIIEEEKD